ncbi:MAG: hypothetical protein IJ106_10880 [Parasporobacterium sp.]|nr:hypothetical protein [Parasporobacterium sp.]
MTWIYAGILAFMTAALLLSRRSGKKFPGKRETSADLLRIFYPLAAGILLFRDRIFGGTKDLYLTDLLKSLYVKENIETEKRMYRIRKTAVILAVFYLTVLSGFLVCAAKEGITYIHSLERAGQGQPATSYEMEVDYRGQKEPVNLRVDSVRYSESEIVELFEQSLEGVRKEVLGDNESPESVTQPLHLITQYRGFDIFWEIEDISQIGYNGEIRADLREGENRLVNLYATFSLDEVTRIYTIPVNLCRKTRTEQEKLLDSILSEIARTNDIHDKKVRLPEEINGYRILFMQNGFRQGYLFLILAAAAVLLILLFYDRTLEQKVRKRKEQMMMDFTEIVSKLSLLYDAGLSIHGAFERVVEDYEKKSGERPPARPQTGKRKRKDPEDPSHFAYREMKLALEKIRAGEGEGQAYSQFGRRCGLYPYLKLGNLLEQNLSKGTKGMQALLKKEVEDAFEERKRLARRKGEEAGTRMLLPMVMMLLVVIVIIAVPALMSIRY